MAPAPSFARLLALELRALSRPRFALAGAAVVLGLVALVAATLGAGGNGLQAHLFFSLLVLPAAFAPLAAAHVASLRAPGAAERLLTAPVELPRLVAARVAALGALALAYLAAGLPILLAYGAGMGAFPARAGNEVAFGALLALFALLAGAALALLLPGRTASAPVAAAAGAMLLSLLAGVAKAFLLGEPGQEWLLRALHVFPHVSLAEALDVSMGDRGHVVASRARSWLAFLATLAALAALCAFALRRQGPEGWRAPRAGRTAALVALALLLAPTALATGEYAPALRPAPRQETLPATLEGGALALDEPERRVLLVELPPGAQAAGPVRASAGGGLEARVAGEPEQDGRTLRVPLRLHAVGVTGLGANAYGLTVRVPLAGGGEAVASATVVAAGEGGAWTLGAAGALVAAVPALLAWRRTRALRGEAA